MIQLLNLKDRYPFECSCGFKSTQVAPSIFMSCFQLNLGGVHCPKCKKHISVRINETNDALIPIAEVPDGVESGPLPAACYRDATPEEEKIIAARK